MRYSIKRTTLHWNTCYKLQFIGWFRIKAIYNA